MSITRVTSLKALGLASADAETRYQTLMTLAYKIAREMSDDPDTRTSCVAVLSNGTVLADANRLPFGVQSLPERMVRPEKYDWIEHAERTVVHHAASEGFAMKGAEVYIPWFPCVPCARALAGTRIATLFAVEPDLSTPRWGEQFPKAMEIMREAGIEVDLCQSALAC